MVRDFGGVTVINAGTLLGDEDPCFVLADFSEPSVTFYSIGPGGAIVESAKHEL
jgi:hypothetical protein